MNKEEIIKLAQEAGLIRAGENYTEPARWGISEITDFYQRAVAHEREACAKLVEADGLARGSEGLVLIKAAGRIRARGEG